MRKICINNKEFNEVRGKKAVRRVASKATAADVRGSWFSEMLGRPLNFRNLASCKNDSPE